MALGGGFPQLVPVVVIERQAHALEGQVSALEPHRGAAAHFVGRDLRVVVGNDGQREDPVRIGALGEIHGPVVVDLVRPGALLAVGDHLIDHEAAVDDLGVDAVAIEVGKPQFGRGRSRLGAPAVVPLEA